MSGSEIVFLLIIGLVVLGPEKLPDAIRRVGRIYSELKRMSHGVTSDLRQVMDEPMKEFMKTTNTAKALFNDPLKDIPGIPTAKPDFIRYLEPEVGDAEEPEQVEDDPQPDHALDDLT